MSWRLAKSLETLRDELNQRWPNRDHASDGAIGDARHAATPSDHNPNVNGVVCAYDIDTDLDGTDDSNDPEMDALVEWLREHPHRDLKYVIYRGRMFSRYEAHGFAPFQWRPYGGSDRHITHPHVSVGVGPDGMSSRNYDDTDAWLDGFNVTQEEDMTPEQSAKLDTAEFNSKKALEGLDAVFAAVGRIEKAVVDLKNTAGPSGTVKVSGELKLG